MTAAQRSAGSRSVGDVLQSRRLRWLVGRDVELESFETMLAADGPAVVFVHGPGGVGKTSLLELFAELAAGLGVPVRRLDGRELSPTRSAVREAVSGFPTDGRQALVLDGFERLTPLESWFRDSLLPSLPASVVTVLAGRRPPDAGWRADPAWRDVLHLMALRNLDRKACESYLQQSRIDPALHDRIVEVTHGHPLALSLLVDVVSRGGRLEADPLEPDLVAVLLRQLLDVVPDADQRRALGVCALARVTTEPLLRAALDLDEADTVFEWLRGMSFIETTDHGLAPHDLARDALDADMRWRDRDDYTATFRRIVAYLVTQLETAVGPDQLRAILDAKFMHRHQPISEVWADWETFGRNHPEPARPEDRQAILEIVEAWEGRESAEIAARWLDRQPQGFAVVRQAEGQVRGVLGLVDLTAATQADLAMDPGAQAAWEHARRHCPPRPGELVTMSRFILDDEEYQRPSPTMNLAPVSSIQHFLNTPGLRCSYIAVSDPERWEDYFTFFEIRRVADGDFGLGGRGFGLFVRDFGQIPLKPWLRFMFERDLLGVHAASPYDAGRSVVALSREDFEAAVRQALRDLRRTDRLSANPLLRSRLVQERVDADSPIDALRSLVGEAAERLREDPRDEKLFRVIDRTFLRAAPSQEKAAEMLGLPFSTFKRHLRAGVGRIITFLWDRELGQN